MEVLWMAVTGYLVSHIPRLKNWRVVWMNVAILLVTMGSVGGLFAVRGSAASGRDYQQQQTDASAQELEVRQAINTQQIANNASNIDSLRKEVEYQRDQILLQRDQMAETRGIGIGIGIFLSVLQGVQILVQLRQRPRADGSSVR